MRNLVINDTIDKDQAVRIDEIKWWVTQPAAGPRLITALCPKHNLRMKAVPPKRFLYGRPSAGLPEDGGILNCAEGPHAFALPRTFKDEKQYVLDRIDSRAFRNMQVLNLDDEAVPLSKAKVASKDERYFVTAQLMRSKKGLQLVIYAGEKGKSGKTQIFVDPSIKKLSFDQSNLHPNDVFTKIEAVFRDGTKFTTAKKAVDKG